MHLHRGFLLLAILSGTMIAARTRKSTFDKDVTLSTWEKAQLDKFKEEAQHLVPQDYMRKELYLLKFLRYRDFDIEQAKKFLLEVLKWREENRMDEILTEDFSDMKRHFKYYLSMRDKDAEPVLFLSVAGMDIRREVLAGREKRLLRYVDSGIEAGCALVREFGEKYQNVTRGHLIVDAMGYNLVEQGCLRCLPAILRMIVSYELHWPECVDKTILVNFPSIAHPLIEAARPLLSRQTREGLVLLGTNRKQNHDYLLNLFHIEEIPTSLGGLKVLEQDDNDDYYNDT